LGPLDLDHARARVGHPAGAGRRRHCLFDRDDEKAVEGKGHAPQPICKPTPSSSRVAVMTGTPPAEAPSAPTLTVDGACATIRLKRPRHHNRIETGDIATLCEQFTRIEETRRI